MKWTKVVSAISFLILLVSLLYILYPTVSPLIAHSPRKGWLTAIVSAVFTTKQNPLAEPFPYMLLGLIGCVWLTATIEVRTRKRSTHGSAHFATRREAYAFVHTPRRFPHLLHLPRLPRLPHMRHTTPALQRPQQPPPPPESHLILGTYHGRVISLTEQQQESNVLLTAPIGAGKTARVIIPNLLQEQASRSLFISDVKGELVRLTAGRVSQFHDVWVFSPVKPQESEGYNPLAFLRSVEDAQEFARCWVANTGKSKEAFWPNSAIKLMTATLLHLRAAEPDAPFSRVADILCTMPYEQMKRTLTTSPSRQARDEVSAFFAYMDKNPKLVGSLMADVGTRFQLLASEHIRAVTARNDIDFAAMADRPIALYLSIPRRYQERYQPLLACFMMQMFAAWEERAEQEPDGQLPRGIMCYLDEFANLGFIPNISGYISTARHTRVALLLVLQSFSQLDEKYGQEVRKNILANTVTHLLLPGAGQEETEYYSRRIGNTTVRTETHSTSGSGIDARETWAQGETGRRLMTPDELRTMPEDHMLIVISRVDPLVLRTKLYYRVRRLAQLANLSFPHVRVYQKPPAAPGSPTPPAQEPPMVIDSDQAEGDDQDNDQFFLQE